MGIDTLVIISSIAFWLGYCYGRNSNITECVAPRTTDGLSRPIFDWTVLGDGLIFYNRFRNVICECSKQDSTSTTDMDCKIQGDLDDDGVESKEPEVAARFLADGRLVIEEKAVAARRNGAELDRRRAS